MRRMAVYGGEARLRVSWPVQPSYPKHTHPFSHRAFVLPPTPFHSAYNTNFALYSTTDAYRYRFVVQAVGADAARAAAAKAAILV